MAASTPPNGEVSPSMIVKLRTAFLTHGLKVLSVVAIGQLVVIVVLGIALLTQVSKPVQVQYLGLTEDMRVIQLPATTEPYLDIIKVKSFAEDRLRNANEWSHRNYRERWTGMERDFTNTGFVSWTQAQAAVRLPFVRDNELAVSFRLDSLMPIGAGVTGGTYRWRFEVRGAIIYSASGRADRVEPLDILLDVVRVDTRRNGLGIAIDAINERPGRR